MMSLSMLSSLIPSVVLALIWAAGLIVCLIRPERGRWRLLAMGGFGALTLATVLGLVPQVVLMTLGYAPNIAAMFGIVGLVSLAISLVGIVLLIAAVISERPGGASPR